MAYESESELSKQARDYLKSIQTRGWRCSLSEMQRGAETLGNPHHKLKSIHIAGTNAKGSVAAMCASIMKSAGLKTGLFISPHLIDIPERITINGKEIAEDRLASLVLEIRKKLENDTSPPIQLTYFEFLTALGFLHFLREDVYDVVAEVGLGGRFDATNVLGSNVAVITQIGLDHMEQLGDTIEKVAAEKAGIIKKGSGVVSAANDSKAMDVIRNRAFELNCSLIESGKDFNFNNVHVDLNGTTFDYEGTRILENIKTNLLGSHQAENAATAIAACDVFAHQEGFEIKDEHILRGLQNVHWPGRLDIVSRKPLMILDCAHNPSAVRRLLRSFDELKISPDTLIYSTSKDKDYTAVVSMLFPRVKRLILTKYGSERAVDPAEIAGLPEAKGKNAILTDRASEAIEKAKESTPTNETVLVIGSIFLVGDVLSWLKYGKAGDFSLAGFRSLDSPKS